MNKLLQSTPAVALMLLSVGALADETGLKRCRAIAEAAARLACYDALPLSAGAAAPAAPRVAAPAPRDAAPGLVERFGMEEKAAPLPQAQRIESHIPGRFTGWGPNSQIRLANGQVWQVVDDSSLRREWDNPKVVVRRGMLGSFFLDIEGDNRSPRVKRVR